VNRLNVYHNKCYVSFIDKKKNIEKKSRGMYYNIIHNNMYINFQCLQIIIVNEIYEVPYRLCT